MNEKLSRRDFIWAAGTAGLFAAVNSRTMTAIAGESANEKIIVAVAGIRSRGRYLAKEFAGLPNCEVKYVVDVDKRYFEGVVKDVTETQNKAPETLADFSRALDDKDVDALVIATPDHWHAPMAIEALKAEKHVYVEKPCSHNPAEGEMLIAAQKKYGKVVQMGSQRRSSLVTKQMIEEIRQGIIGDVYYARAWYARYREPIGFGKIVPVPDYLDFDMWQGPAPRTAYRDNVHPYNWHWFWNWGTGEALNNGTHELDVARWAMGVNYPAKVTSLGGRYNFVGQDDWECPDTQTITIEFAEKKSIVWEGKSCSNYKEEGDGRGVTLYGTKGTIVYLTDRYKVLDKDNKLVKQVGNSTAGDTTNVADPGLGSGHMENFLDAIRGSKKQTAPIDEGHKSVLLGHLGNISLRVGRTLNCNPVNGHILKDKEAAKLWRREYEPRWEPKI